MYERGDLFINARRLMIDTMYICDGVKQPAEVYNKYVGLRTEDPFDKPLASFAEILCWNIDRNSRLLERRKRGTLHKCPYYLYLLSYLCRMYTRR